MKRVVNWPSSKTLTTIGTPIWRGDRKSTRLNSSHGYISYAVFCLKKKNKERIERMSCLLGGSHHGICLRQNTVTDMIFFQTYLMHLYVSCSGSQQMRSVCRQRPL